MNDPDIIGNQSHIGLITNYLRGDFMEELKKERKINPKYKAIKVLKKHKRKVFEGKRFTTSFISEVFFILQFSLYSNNFLISLSLNSVFFRVCMIIIKKCL